MATGSRHFISGIESFIVMIEMSDGAVDKSGLATHLVGARKRTHSRAWHPLTSSGTFAVSCNARFLSPFPADPALDLCSIPSCTRSLLCTTCAAR